MSRIKADTRTIAVCMANNFSYFFMNTQSSSGLLEFLRNIDPLDFDPELANEYLDCFQSDKAKAFVMDELEARYDELPNSKERLWNHEANWQSSRPL